MSEQTMIQTITLLLFDRDTPRQTESKQNNNSLPLNPTLFPKSVGYLKSDNVGFKIFVLVQLYKFE